MITQAETKQALERDINDVTDIVHDMIYTLEKMGADDTRLCSNCNVPHRVNFSAYKGISQLRGVENRLYKAAHHLGIELR